MADLKQPKPESIASLMLGKKDPEGDGDGPDAAAEEGDPDCQAALEEFFDAGKEGDMAAAEKALRAAVLCVMPSSSAKK